MSRRTLLAAAVTLLISGIAVAENGHATESRSPDEACGGELDDAIEAFDASFAAQRLDAYMAFYVTEAVQVDAQGQVFKGKEAIAEYIEAVMANDYTFSATVLRTTRNGCHSAAVVEDSVFAIPAQGLTLHLIDGVSWVRDGDEWKVVQVQNTMVPTA